MSATRLVINISRNEHSRQWVIAVYGRLGIAGLAWCCLVFISCREWKACSRMLVECMFAPNSHIVTVVQSTDPFQA